MSSSSGQPFRGLCTNLHADEKAEPRFARPRATPLRLLLPALIFLGGAHGSARAQSSLAWGPNQLGTPAGGNGAWNTASGNWTEGDGTYRPWQSGAGTVAVFGGAAGSVSVESPLSAGGLTFGAGGYVINRTGGNVLTLSPDSVGFAPQITFLNPSQSATINAPLAGSNGLYLVGSGTLVLGGANTLTGAISTMGTSITVLSATGSLNGNEIFLGSGVVERGGGGSFTLDNTGASGASAQSLGLLNLFAGDGIVRANRVAAQNLSLTFTGQNRSVGATVNYVVSGGSNGTSNRINLTSGPTGFVDRGTFFGGSSFAWKDAGGFLRGINYGTDAGTLTTAGTTSVATTGHVQATGNLTAQNSATFSTLRLAGASNVALNGGATLTVTGLLKAGGGSSTISGGNAIRPASNAEMIIRTDAASDTLTISSAIVANGAGGNALTKTGLGTLVLSGNNTYANGTYLNAGTLSVATLPTGAGSSSIGTGGLTVSGGTLQYTGASVTTTRSVQFLASGGGVEVSSAATTLTLDGPVIGANTYLAADALVKTGPGTLVLAGGTGTDNVGLTLVVNAGTVQLAKTNANSHAVSGLFINSGGTVQLAGSGNDQIYNGSSVVVNTGGTLDLNGRRERIDGLSGGGSITSQSTTANSILTVGGNFDANIRTNFSGVISDGSGGRVTTFNRVGPGTQTLSGANTYSGGTNINGGKLLVDGVGVDGVSSGTGLGLVTVNGTGSLLGGLGAIQGAVTLNGGAEITGGDSGSIGTLALRSSLTFAGSDLTNLATYLVDLSTGANSDRLQIVGLLDLGGSFDQILFRGTVDGTSSYVLASYGSISGVFDNVANLPANYTLQYGGNALTLVPLAVPEPTTWIAGLLALGACRLARCR